MYALAIPTLIALWGMTRGEAGLLGTTVLIMASPGGWIAGILADRYGRVLFVIGLLPTLLVLWIRRHIKTALVFAQTRGANTADRPSI